MIVYGFERPIVRLKCGTGRQSYNQVHVRPKRDGIPCPAQWRVDRQTACFAINCDVHKAIERHRYHIFRYAEWCQCVRQIAEATMMRISIAINDAEGVLATRRQQKVMATDIVRDNFQHDIAAI